MSASLLLARAESIERYDPLKRFRFRCQGQRDYARYFFAGLDVHAFAPNAGGKSFVGCAAVLAILEGKKKLDNLDVPQVPLPVTFWLLTKTRRGQVDSSQAALLALLGDWPHKIGYAARGLDYIEQVRVYREGGSDDPEKWPKLTFHCEEGDASLPGGRVDGALADEPQDPENWGEVRARGKPGRRFFLGIGETPIKRSEWWWLFEDERGYRNCLNRPRDGRVSVNWSLDEVHPPDVVQALRDRYAGQPEAQARLTGWPVNDESVLPFSGRALAMFQRLKPRIVRIPLFEPGSDAHDTDWAEYQLWCKANDWGRYALVGDPSKGINIEARSPSGFGVFEESDPAWVARYNGRLDPYAFGRLAGAVGNVYRKADAHIETQGGYGLEAIRALRLMRYPNIAREVKQNNPSGAPRHDWGFSTSEGSKRAWIAAIQMMLEDKIKGRPTMNIWSPDVLDNLADAEIDRETGKLIQDEHHRIEDIIILGYQLHRTLGPKRMREIPRERDPVGRALRAEFGREIRPGRGQSAAAPEGFRR